MASSKKKRTIIVAVLLALLIATGIWAISGYNRFVSLSQDVDRQWGLVQAQYQRRMDLIPNLVRTVQGYAAHESNTFETVTRARAGLDSAMTRAAVPAGFEGTNAAQGQVDRALAVYVNAVHEAYPTLVASTQFQDLQVQLEGTENRIATERNRYTDAVTAYNKQVLYFPSNILAAVFGYEPKPQFEAQAEAAYAPTVEFPQ